MLTTIHLVTCDAFQQQALSGDSQIIIDAFTESCKALDASIFEPFMEEDNVFEDKNKYIFLAGLKVLFDSYKDNKPLFFNVAIEDGTCAGCNYGKNVKIFSVKGWGRIIFKDRFAYVIDKNKGILKDIYRCNLF